jgi:hypothetical protein
MKLNVVKKNFRYTLIISGVCFLFLCITLAPVMGDTAKDYCLSSSEMKQTLDRNGGDVPTWYQGDQWIYTVNPLYFSSPNGTFSGRIDNFKQKVSAVSDDTYTITITGDISGDITVSGFSGQLSGVITGTSSIRISDLAEQSTELHSQGTIIYLIPFPYTLDLLTSSTPALELYDFPLQIGEQWHLGTLTTLSGSFSIQGIYDQSFEGSQLIDETVECTQKEPITTPAGTFECYTIGRSTTQSWYSTDVGNMVKSTIDQSSENTTLQIDITLQSFSHAAPPITVSEDITPSMVAPGASVVISGQAVSTSSGDPIQNGVITIQIPSTGDSWSTTTNSAGYYSKTITAPTIHDDTPMGREIGSDGVIVHCTSGNLKGYIVQTLTIIQDTAPATPIIDGTTDGKIGVSYPYTFAAIDFEDDAVYYFVDWGDTTNSSWIGPYTSNQNVTLDHTFSKKGSYTIRVKAKDMYYAESDWGVLDVTMPTLSSYPILLKFLDRFPLLSYLLQRFLGL